MIAAVITAIDVQEMEFRIRYCGSARELPDIAAGLAELGEAAIPLIPALVEKCPAQLDWSLRRQLLPLYEATRSPVLGRYLLRNRKELGVQDKCRLFDAGLAGLEEDLLGALHERWHNLRDAANIVVRAEIVETLGRHGSEQALRMLEVIRSRLSGEFGEWAAKVRMSGAATEDPVFLSENLDAWTNATFLETVQEAVAALGRRVA